MTQFSLHNLQHIQEQWDLIEFKWLKEEEIWICALWNQGENMNIGTGESMELAFYDADPWTITGKDGLKHLKRVSDIMSEQDESKGGGKND